MSNNVIKCNTMIDNECKELTGIEIENLDINDDKANKQLCIISVPYDELLAIIYANSDQFV